MEGQLDSSEGLKLVGSSMAGKAPWADVSDVACHLAVLHYVYVVLLFPGGGLRTWFGASHSCGSAGGTGAALSQEFLSTPRL